MPLLEELKLFAHHVDTRDLFALPLPHWRVLSVNHLQEYRLEVLADNSSLGNLTHLSFRPHMLTPFDNEAYLTRSSVRALVHSPHLKSLTHLRLCQSDLGDEG